MERRVERIVEERSLSLDPVAQAISDVLDSQGASFVATTGLTRVEMLAVKRHLNKHHRLEVWIEPGEESSYITIF